MRRKVYPVRWSTLRRLEPVSTVYGIDRGTPIDRVYIESFLLEHKSAIAGSVLEVGYPQYTNIIGKDRVAESFVLDIDPANSQANLIADLNEPDSLPEAKFDCFILTQTLQYVRNPVIALTNARRALKVGGVLLITVPTIARLDPTAGRENDFWRLTPAGLNQLLRSLQSKDEIQVCSFGNLISATAFLMGLASEDLRSGELDRVDPDHPVLACARVTRTL